LKDFWHPGSSSLLQTGGWHETVRFWPLAHSTACTLFAPPPLPHTGLPSPVHLPPLPWHLLCSTSPGPDIPAWHGHTSLWACPGHHSCLALGDSTPPPYLHAPLCHHLLPPFLCHLASLGCLSFSPYHSIPLPHLPYTPRLHTTLHMPTTLPLLYLSTHHCSMTFPFTTTCPPHTHTCALLPTCPTCCIPFHLFLHWASRHLTATVFSSCTSPTPFHMPTTCYHFMTHMLPPMPRASCMALCTICLHCTAHTLLPFLPPPFSPHLPVPSLPSYPPPHPPCLCHACFRRSALSLCFLLPRLASSFPHLCFYGRLVGRSQWLAGWIWGWAGGTSPFLPLSHAYRGYASAPLRTLLGSDLSPPPRHSI